MRSASKFAVCLVVLSVNSCGLPETEEEWEDLLGPALSLVLDDGVLTCSENWGRETFNQCPDRAPETGTDENGVTWVPDLFLGVLPNPFHQPLDCYRGVSPELGLSSYQCCYDDSELVTDDPLAGSFDYVFPYLSPLTALWHYLLDILPPRQCGGFEAL